MVASSLVTGSNRSRRKVPLKPCLAVFTIIALIAAYAPCVGSPTPHGYTVGVLAVGGLTYRRIDPVADEAFAYENYLAACAASYGDASKALSAKRYRAWLRSRVEEYPDGNVFALLDNTPLGQLELQAPYGLATGYINLYAVAAPFRGMGFGRLMHGYVERYFRSWDVREVELHVSPNNVAALNLYRSLGYAFVKQDGRQWLMRRTV